MFLSPSTCPLAHSPEDALLPYATLLVLFFLLSIPAGVPTPYRLPSTSQFLATSLTQDQHFFGRLSQDVFELSLYHLFSFSIFFLIFIKAVSPAIQSCSLCSLSLSFISRGRKEVSAGFCPAWHWRSGLSQSAVLPCFLASLFLWSVGHAVAPHHHLCPPQCCSRGSRTLRGWWYQHRRGWGWLGHGWYLLLLHPVPKTGKPLHSAGHALHFPGYKLDSYQQ